MSLNHIWDPQDGVPCHYGEGMHGTIAQWISRKANFLFWECFVAAEIAIFLRIYEKGFLPECKYVTFEGGHLKHVIFKI